jgi:hypothetical protein
MIWPFKRHKPRFQTEAEAAHVDALANLARAQARAPEVSDVVSTLREFRERNHFADTITTMLGGTR